VDFISAHALGDPELDRIEARAIAQVFGVGESAPVVFATKGWTGYLGAAAGPIELVFTLLAMEHGQLPGSINCENLDPECPVRVHTGGLRPIQKPYVLKVGYTDMGQCAAIVLRRFDK
jgi:3-oxoacyl-[acyl-carrier-protein] synthase II